MFNPHESYLSAFFAAMNFSFAGQWCVLHSYETLPGYSESDVDMALNSTNIPKLEKTIKGTAKKTGWSVYQKLWYDVPKSTYYVLKKDDEDIFLALDFLIDPNGIGRYGFDTTTLTQDCVLLKNLFPVPNHEVAFCYKLVKRIVKKRSMLNELAYLKEHLDRANKVLIAEILKTQFSVRGMKLITTKIKGADLDFTTEELDFLKKEKTTPTTILAQKFFWQIRRGVNRVCLPKGMLINIPILPEEELKAFQDYISGRTGILFRYVKVNKALSLKLNFKSITGSTLIINPRKDFLNQKVIKTHWLKPTYYRIELTGRESVEEMAEIYFQRILKVMDNRVLNV